MGEGKAGMAKSPGLCTASVPLACRRDGGGTVESPKRKTPRTAFGVIASETKQSRRPMIKWFEIAAVAEDSFAMTFREFLGNPPIFPLVMVLPSLCLV
jgi:hypothetical protein